MEPSWSFLPQELLAQIFLHLDVGDIGRGARVCASWAEAASDTFLWKRKFAQDFGICHHCARLPKAKKHGVPPSWLGEYRRIVENTPWYMTDELKDHSHQVLHVSFSHNGRFFATCSKDGYVLLWDAGHPARILHYCDMSRFSWKYTQFSEFNADDSLLLVSGVHFGRHSVTGEIAVFSIGDDFELQCRINNKPYDIFGAWFNAEYVISGELRWLNTMLSESKLWLNKAHQETSSELIKIRQPMFRFFNGNVSFCRMLKMAEFSVRASLLRDGDVTSGNPVSGGQPVGRLPDDRHVAVPRPAGGRREQSRLAETAEDGAQVPGEGVEPGQSAERDSGQSAAASCSRDGGTGDHPEEGRKEKKQHVKYLIFTTGSKTYTPHQIGFKRLDGFHIETRMRPGPTLRERVEFRRRAEALREELLAAGLPLPEVDWHDWDAVKDQFDDVDHLIDLHGHIIGMCLSPDQRYLYVNTRPWPQNYVIENPMNPPPIACEIDIHVIDVATKKLIGKSYGAHRAYTCNEGCFFLFVDVTDQFVASGAEDRHAYLWDRHHACCLGKYPHLDVVNAVAFSQRDPGLLVTVSDDTTVKVWRSRNNCRALGIDVKSLPSPEKTCIPQEVGRRRRKRCKHMLPSTSND